MPRNVKLTITRKTNFPKLSVMPPPPPPPHTPIIIRGYLCSFPITWTPMSLERYIPPIRGNYKLTPIPGLSLEIFPDYAPKYSLPSRENRNTYAAPLCIRVRGGGVGGRCHLVAVMGSTFCFFVVAKIALRGSHGRTLGEGVTVSSWHEKYQLLVLL